MGNSDATVPVCWQACRWARRSVIRGPRGSHSAGTRIFREIHGRARKRRRRRRRSATDGPRWDVRWTAVDGSCTRSFLSRRRLYVLWLS